MLPQAVARDNQYIVQALERQWILDHSQNLEALWEAMSSADFADERIPYWTELWPASLGLAEWLSCRRAEIAGQPCLDLGCGIGFTAMIGQYLGAKTIACDYEQAALAAALANCRRNDCPMPRFLAMDWRKPALARGSMARIWAGDILYEKRAMQPVLKIIGHLLAMDGKAWIAEPGRTIFGQFTDMAREAGWEIARARTLRVAAIEPPGPHAEYWHLGALEDKAMSELARFGVSIDADLLAAFDQICAKRGYVNRSEAIRDLIRQAINEEQWGGSAICGGTLTLVYDHHRHDLARRIMDIQHDSHDIIVATMHVHLDHNNCMECLAIKGDVEAVRNLAQKLVACRGVKYGVFNRAPNGEDLT